MDGKNGKFNLFCVRCNSDGQFLCERCSDPYCSKACQARHWPFHRPTCFPMPSLLKIPNEINTHSMLDAWKTDALPQLQHLNHFKPKSNNYNRNYVQRPIRPGTSTNYSRNYDNHASQPRDLESQNAKKSNENPVSDEVVKLAPIIESNKRIPNPKSSDLQTWRQHFPLENGASVTVLYFIETPTISCWVVQNQYVTKRKELLDEMRRLVRDAGVVAIDKIILGEVYCLKFEESYHRGECLYRIDSKNALFRLIDVGRTVQVEVSSVLTLHPLYKTEKAYAIEINFESPLAVTTGQILRIQSFRIDAVSSIYVKVEEVGKGDEIKLTSLPLGIPMELFCLDYSNLTNGIISVCKCESAEDTKKIDSINALSDKISDWVKEKTENYSPKVEDVCFAYHDSDRQWYRAECLNKISSDIFEVLFIDYGCTRKVSSSNLRKFDPEFSEPAIMNFLRIDGLPLRPNPEVAEKITRFFDQNPKFSITDLKYEEDIYIAKCPDLLKALEQGK
ncbi:Tudor domain-containing 6 [Pseudolycoriella hygida]|uniref:Tudor domain-containing 6 n=1 Tax=Pseudolycoriella hygida TaxID=35572 RepID=A0A9Q0NDU3_9DIPT|nr:Tudor domain-containing 6 [Pseudolycoriella hygida]